MRTLGLTVPGLVWVLLPARRIGGSAVLAGQSRHWLVGVVTGRLFVRTRLFWAVPRAGIWRISAGILGLVLAISPDRSVAALSSFSVDGR
ncbi:hypothetical protein GCM10009735_58380 [Actinomadura chokoriensis]